MLFGCPYNWLNRHSTRHNIHTNFGWFYCICKQFIEGGADRNVNHAFYRRSPRMADLKAIALPCTMEALGIVLENLLWSKIRTNYPTWSQNLICRTRLNAAGADCGLTFCACSDRISSLWAFRKIRCWETIPDFYFQGSTWLIVPKSIW